MTTRRPIILGIAGDSAAGKTTITQGLMNILGADCVTHVCTDDYHKYDRQERAERGITPLRPECNYIDVLEQHLERLHYGQPILKPVYEHATGTLIRPEYVQPRQFVLVEGLLGFSTPTLRQFYDVKVYLDPPEDLRKAWKLKRDTTRRGYTTEQVLAELERREPDSRELYSPAARVCRRRREVLSAEWHSRRKRRDPNLNVRLVLRPTIPHPDLSYLDPGTSTALNGQAHRASGVRLKLARDDGRPVDVLEIDGDVAGTTCGRIGECNVAASARPAAGERRSFWSVPRMAARCGIVRRWR